MTFVVALGRAHAPVRIGHLARLAHRQGLGDVLLEEGVHVGAVGTAAPQGVGVVEAAFLVFPVHEDDAAVVEHPRMTVEILVVADHDRLAAGGRQAEQGGAALGLDKGTGALVAETGAVGDEHDAAVGQPAGLDIVVTGAVGEPGEFAAIDPHAVDTGIVVGESLAGVKIQRQTPEGEQEVVRLPVQIEAPDRPPTQTIAQQALDRIFRIGSPFEVHVAPGTVLVGYRSNIDVPLPVGDGPGGMESQALDRPLPTTGDQPLATGPAQTQIGAMGGLQIRTGHGVAGGGQGLLVGGGRRLIGSRAGILDQGLPPLLDHLHGLRHPRHRAMPVELDQLPGVVIIEIVGRPALPPSTPPAMIGVARLRAQELRQGRGGRVLHLHPHGQRPFRQGLDHGVGMRHQPYRPITQGRRIVLEFAGGAVITAIGLVDTVQQHVAGEQIPGQIAVLHQAIHRRPGHVMGARRRHGLSTGRDLPADGLLILQAAQTGGDPGGAIGAGEQGPIGGHVIGQLAHVVLQGHQPRAHP